MPFPTTIEGLEAQGYKFDGHSRCSGPHCNQELSWYRTPNGKRIPLNYPSLTPHFSTCPDVKRFQKQAEKAHGIEAHK
jgi:hypothetical protein